MRGIGFKHGTLLVYGVLGECKMGTSSDMLVRNPLLPFGLSSPVPIGVHSSQNAGLTLHLYKILFLALT